MNKTRGFEVVDQAHQKYGEKVTVHGKTTVVYPEIVLPVRADSRSAGYDFYAPIDIEVLPNRKVILWTNVKAYMQEDEVLNLYPRSSLGIKKGLMLGNTVGIIDSSYYSNEDNDGNIGLSLLNTSGTSIKISAGERIVQGIFQKYLTVDEDNTLSDERKGGIGSSGE